jgi:hypothetical protein
MTAEGAVSRTNYYRVRLAQRYQQNPEKLQLRSAITYYRKRRADGQPWHPRPSSKLYAWAQRNGLDASKLVTGEQKLSDASPPP